MEIVAECINGSVSASTLKSYRSGWKEFADYCTNKTLDPYQVDHHLVMRYLAHKSKTVGSSRYEHID